MIFNEIKLIFAANQIATSLWLPIFQTNSQAGFIIAQLLILFQLATALKILSIVDKANLTWTEAVLVRTTFSIYGGWITTATILGFAILLKTWGVGTDEEPLGCIFIIFAFVIFTLVSWRQKNPMYCFVFIWASGAILSQLQNKKSFSKNMIAATWVIFGVHSFSMAALSSYLIWNKCNESKVEQAFK